MPADSAPPHTSTPSHAVTKTVQLRRYELFPEEFEAFLEWWSERLAPARQAAGFTIEFACVDYESKEFTWVTSAPGAIADFEALEAAYMESPERTAVFANTPKRIAKAHLAYVTQLI
jgi:hypothetical protein